MSAIPDDNLRRAALLSVLFFIALIVVLFLLDIPVVYEPAYLLFVLNSIFLGIIPLYIAYILFRTYRRSRNISLSFLGAGMLVMGIGAIASGGTIGLPDGPNISVTIYNTTFLAGSVLSFLASLERTSPEEPAIPERRTADGTLIYVLIAGFAFLLIGAALAGVTPPFFVQGSGATLLRQVILAGSIWIFITASIHFTITGKNRQNTFFQGLSFAFALIAIGLFAILLQHAVGSAITWAGRAAQYLGASFALIVILSAERTASLSGISTEALLSRFFNAAESGYRNLIAAASDAIIVFNSDGRIIIWNPAAGAMLGYSSSEVAGRPIAMIIPGCTVEDLVGQEAGSGHTPQSPRELDLRRKDGSALPAEVTFSWHRVDDQWMTTAVIRDLTGARKAESVVKQLLASVQKEQERLWALVNSIPDEIWVAGADEKIELVNPAAAARFSPILTGSDGVRQTAAGSGICYADGTPRPVDQAPLLRALRGEFIREEEEIVRLPVTGELRIRQVNAAPIKDSSGKISGSVSIVRDITDLKRAEERLRESENRLRTLYRSMTEGVAIHEMVYENEMAVDYIIRDVNPAYVAITGLARKDVVGRRGSELYGTGAPPYLDIYAGVAARVGAERFETYFPPMDKHFEISVFSPEKGTFATVFSDITERKQAEKETAKKQAEMRAVFDTIPAGLVLFEAIPPYRVLVHNRCYQELFGEPFRSQGMEGLSVYQYAPAVEAEGVVAVFEKVIRTRQPFHHLDFPYRSKPPNESWFNWYMSPIIVDGQVVSLVSMSIDVTERHNAEAALRMSREQLRADLDAVQMLQNLGTLYLHGGNLDRVLTEIVDAAIAITAADFGNLQLLDPQTGDLRIAASRGFPDWWLDFWSTDGRGKGSCAAALTSGEPVIVEDVETSPIFAGTPALMIQRRAGIRAIQSTPLVSRDGKMLGIFSTHFSKPGRPDDRAFRLLDLLTRQAADIIEQAQAGEALRRAHGELERHVEERTAELNAALTSLATERWRLYDVLDTLPVYVCLLNEEYRMPFANRYFRETFGYDAGRRCHEFLFNLGEPCRNCDTYTVMKTRSPHHWYWTGPNGRDYDIYDFPFTESDGTFMILEMGIDITEQKRAEQALRDERDLLDERVRMRTAELQEKNIALQRAYESISAQEEELRANNDELRQRDEELLVTLQEKDALLSEVHHRVKNNLAAFISLISLDGSYNKTPEGIALRNDLQNRARSMSLIHDTLYRTHTFSTVDMGLYLSTLVEQVVGSYRTDRNIVYGVQTHGYSLDLARATPVGLIVNELVTNALKYAFPPLASTDEENTDDGVIQVNLMKVNGRYLLTVEDNGVGLPEGFDPASSKSLGLKLVKFLTSHQLHGEVAFDSRGGTRCRILFPEKG